MDVQHVVWDWNGTLLDDFDAMVEATNASCLDLRGRPVTPEDYRAHFARPVSRLYEGLLGREITAEEWADINSRFRSSYLGLVATCALAPDAEEALQAVSTTGITQSLLSMWAHDELVAAVNAAGIDSYFVRIQGVASLSGGESKLHHLLDHLGRISSDLGQGLEPETVLLIGDSLDDATAAARAGARCVLVEGGSHNGDALAKSGVPVARSLLEATRLGEVVF